LIIWVISQKICLKTIVLILFIFLDTIKSDVLHEFNNCQTKYINFSNCKLLDCIELEFFKKTNLKIVDLSMCDQLISIDDSSFSFK